MSVSISSSTISTTTVSPTKASIALHDQNQRHSIHYTNTSLNKVSDLDYVINYTVFWSIFGPTIIAVSPYGLCYFAFTEGTNFIDESTTLINDLKSTLQKHVSKCKDSLLQIVQNDIKLQYDREYIQQKLQTIHLDADKGLILHCIGSPFQNNVYKGLLQTKSNELLSYGELAIKIGSEPTASRAIGTACGSNDIMLFVPCHRIVSQTIKNRYTKELTTTKKNKLQPHTILLQDVGNFRWGPVVKSRILTAEMLQQYPTLVQQPQDDNNNDNSK